MCIFCIHLTHFAALAGKFPAEGAYIDARHSRAPAGDLLDANLGRFPLIQTSQGVSIGQSSAINYYIASICGLLGKSAAETALVLSFCAHVQVRFLYIFFCTSNISLKCCVTPLANPSTQELQESWSRLVPFGNAPTERNFKFFFEGDDARDVSGPADGQTISQRFLFSSVFSDCHNHPCNLSISFCLIYSTDTPYGTADALKVTQPRCRTQALRESRHETAGLIGPRGYAVGSQFTLADIIIYNAFGDVLSAAENPGVPPHIREPFGSLSRTEQLLHKHPKVNSRALMAGDLLRHTLHRCS